MKQKWYAILLVVISLIFVFLRLYKLDSSLLFFNDIGRDYWTLWNWQESGKPPLLGPQTSALPYNQSAVYFYVLMPLFLLTGQSPYASVFTLIIFYLGGVVLLYWLTKDQKQLQLPVLLSLLLLTLMPQVIIQNRFVWNPSFLPILLLVAVITWLRYSQTPSTRLLTLLSFVIALTVSLNYSAAPAFVAFWLLTVIRKQARKQRLIAFGIFPLAAVLWNVPTLFFELRHQFLLTQMLLYQEKLPQVATGVDDKLADFVRFIFTGISTPWLIIFVVFLVVAIGHTMIKRSKISTEILSRSLLLFMITLGITLIIPIAVQAHYIFAVATLGLFVVTTLPKRYALLATAFLVFFWLQPHQITSYFQPIYRSFEQSNACAATICETIKEPIFVSVQSDLHPFHNGMEWKYLLARNGCQIRELDTQIDQAELMVVLVDHSRFDFGRTSYNELTQFGPATQKQIIECREHLWAAIIKKTND